MNAIDDFRAALIAAGIIPPTPIIADGHLHRCDADGRNGRGDAAYLLHLDGLPAGGFQNWRDGRGWQDWHANIGRPYTPAERAAYLAQVEETRRKRTAMQLADSCAAMQRAKSIVDRAAPASDSHPYLISKQVRANGLLAYKGMLVMPIKDGSGELQTLQLIRADGKKMFLKNLPTKGGRYVIGTLGQKIYVCEGFATAATIHEATGQGVVAAIDAGNLENVARDIQLRHPDSVIIIVADDDHRSPGNPGLRAASTAACAVNGLIAIPQFESGRGPQDTDFNDLSRLSGRNAVLRDLGAAQPSKPETTAPKVPAGRAVESGSKLVVLRGTDVKPEPIDWIWEGWIARGKLHILASAAGLGKTTLAMSIAATITRGGRFPDGAESLSNAVLIMSYEDGISDTLAPRAIAAGANMQNIHFLQGVRDGTGLRGFDCSTDLSLLGKAVTEIGNVGLVIIDPVVAALGDFDSHKNAETRKALQPLTDWAEATNVGVLGITHFAKNTSARDPLERVVGSLAFGAVGRVVMVAGKSEDSDGLERRILCRAKSNIGPDGGGFAYKLDQKEIQPGLAASFVEWNGIVTGSARSLLATNADTTPGRLSDAKDWLHSLLDSGPRAKLQIDDEARRAGISPATLRRAQSEMGVVATKTGMRGGWQWQLPSRGNAQVPLT